MKHALAILILLGALLCGCSAPWFAHPLGGKLETPERVASRQSSVVSERAAATLTAAPVNAGFVTRLVWSQPDACAGWEVRAQQPDGAWVVVTNISRPLYGDTWTNTIRSPYAGYHGIWSYTR